MATDWSEGGGESLIMDLPPAGPLTDPPWPPSSPGGWRPGGAARPPPRGNGGRPGPGPDRQDPGTAARFPFSACGTTSVVPRPIWVGGSRISRGGKVKGRTAWASVHEPAGGARDPPGTHPERSAPLPCRPRRDMRTPQPPSPRESPKGQTGGGHRAPDPGEKQRQYQGSRKGGRPENSRPPPTILP